MTIRKAINSAISTSDLTVLEKVKLRLAMLFPKLRDQIEAVLVEELTAANMLPSGTTADQPIGTSVDWAAIAAFLKEIMPLILTLIKLFGG